jgi:hypothetical protein
LPRFIAVALLAGYVWLGVAGVLVLNWGAVRQGPDTTRSSMRSSWGSCSP